MPQGLIKSSGGQLSLPMGRAAIFRMWKDQCKSAVHTHTCACTRLFINHEKFSLTSIVYILSELYFLFSDSIPLLTIFFFLHFYIFTLNIFILYFIWSLALFWQETSFPWGGDYLVYLVILIPSESNMYIVLAQLWSKLWSKLSSFFFFLRFSFHFSGAPSSWIKTCLASFWLKI